MQLSSARAGSVWAAPRFPEGGLGAISCCTMPVQVLVVDFLRSPVAECRMETRPIIAELDIARIVLTRFPDRRIYSTVDPLDFHCRVERSTGSTRCGPPIGRSRARRGRRRTQRMCNCFRDHCGISHRPAVRDYERPSETPFASTGVVYGVAD